MLKFFKFLLGFIFFIILIILVNVSFYSGNNNDKINNIEFENFVYSGSYINNINFLDNIYTYTKDNFNILESNNIININLKKGVFILELNDISKQYKIKAKGFNIDLKGGGDIYIDITGKKELIFSLNSSFILTFLDKKGEFVNSSFMYPHEWIKFNPNLNFIYRKADLYRIRTTTQNGYFKNQLSSILDNSKDFIILLGKKNIDLFINYINNKRNIYIKNKIIYKKIFSLKVSIFLFSKYINNYKNYFVNDSKKVVFLQNNIFNLIIKLLHSEKYDSITLSNIKSDLNELKGLNKLKYNETKSFILSIYKSILLNYDVLNIVEIQNFNSIISNQLVFKNIENYFILRNIYINNDINNFDYKFNIFLSSYINKINKKVGNNIELESFNFFLGEYILGNLFVVGNYKFELDLDILKNYISINKELYFSKEKNIVKIKTSLIKNKEIINKLEGFLRKTFFEKDRDILTNLLLYKKNNIDFDLILKFEKNINYIFNFFINNKIYLNTININKYIKLNKLIEEEFLALKDNEAYKLHYNKNLGDLYYSSGIGAKKLKEFSKEDIIKYLNTFNKIYFNVDNVLLRDKYFEIKNIKIYDNLYDFNLYPNLGNKLNIFKHLSGNEIKQKTFSYNLDILKILLDNKYKGASQKEKYKYDFKNFFIEKFKPKLFNENNQNTIEDICALRNMIPDPEKENGCILKNRDNDTISVFKNNILIGEEFSTIKDYFHIKYENLDVNFNKKEYIIGLKDVELNINKKENNTYKTYEIILYGNYDFKNHIFYNIKFKIKDSKNNYLFNGSFISAQNRQIKIFDLKIYFENFLKNFSKIKSIFNILRGKFILNNLKIEDIFGKIFLKFETNNKNIVIKVEKDKILSIIVENVNILDNSININNLKNYINKINKYD